MHFVKKDSHVCKHRLHRLGNGIIHITKTCLCNIRRFYSCEKRQISVKMFVISFVAQNKDCGYMVQPPH